MQRQGSDDKVSRFFWILLIVICSFRHQFKGNTIKQQFFWGHPLQNITSYQHGIATFTSHWLHEDINMASNPLLDISTLCSTFSAVFVAAGATGLLQVANGMSESMVNALKPHVDPDFIDHKYFNYSKVVPGSEFWPRHWAGTFLHQKGLDHNVSASQIIAWLQLLQHKSSFAAFGFASVSAMHAVIWTSLTAHFKKSLTFPLRTTNKWCAKLGEHDFDNRIGTDLARECVHGIGHAVYYGVLNSYGLVNITPCNVLRPERLILPEWLVNQGLNICLQAPTVLWREYCRDGFIHSVHLYRYTGRMREV